MTSGLTVKGLPKRKPGPKPKKVVETTPRPSAMDIDEARPLMPWEVDFIPKTISLRDLFAAVAMNGLLHTVREPDRLRKASFLIADAMLDGSTEEG